MAVENGKSAADRVSVADRSALAQGGLAISGTVLGHVVQVYQSAPGPAKLGNEEVEHTLVAYLRWVRNAYDKARLYGLENAPVARPAAVQKLSDVFIPVTLRRHWPPTRREAEHALTGLSGLDALIAWHNLTQSRERVGSLVEFSDVPGAVRPAGNCRTGRNRQEHDRGLPRGRAGQSWTDGRGDNLRAARQRAVDPGAGALALLPRLSGAY